MKVVSRLHVPSLLVGCFSLVLVCVQSAPAAATLRWKFQPGKTIHYEMQQDMEMSMNMQGRDIKTKTAQTMDMTWRVEAVNPDRSCDMRQTFDRIRFVMDGPTGRIEYDSSNAEPPKDPVLSMIAPMFGAMVGAEFSLRMDPLGNVSEVKMPDKFRDALTNNPAGRMTGMTEDSMKQMLQQAALVLPEAAVSQNDRWNSQTQVEMPFGLMKTNNQMTYLGTESIGNRKVEKIGINSKLSIEAKPGSQFDISVDDQDITGVVQFDNASGNVHGTTMTQKMVMKIDAGGQTFEQAMTQTVSLKLKAGNETSR